ncbi:MAG: baseplate J/gp47 family protein [Alphaproteobacteria bacterium]|nr:baseplate J/gp47 family protein [Alphaproteobacteria bacterium]
MKAPTQAELVAQARALLPRYCPAWTDLGDGDPGMALIHLFAWLTAATLARVEEVPERAALHLLGALGVPRQTAIPAEAWVGLVLRGGEPLTVPPGLRLVTGRVADAEQLEFRTTNAVTVSEARLQRVLVATVSEGGARAVELDCRPCDGGGLALAAPCSPFEASGASASLAGVPRVEAVWIHHPLLAASGVGELEILAAARPELPVAGLFRWDRPQADGGAIPVEIREAPDLGLPDRRLVLDGMAEGVLGRIPGEQTELPPSRQRGWIRGVVDHEAWLAERMRRELVATWRDEVGAEAHTLVGWRVRGSGTTLELELPGLPALRHGWRLGLALVDHGLATGASAHLPLARWSIRSASGWQPVPREQVRLEGACIILSGPLPAPSSGCWHLRAQRVEAVALDRVLPGLRTCLRWSREAATRLAEGADPAAAVPLDPRAEAWTPWQAGPGLPLLPGQRLFVGSELLGLSGVATELVLELRAPPVHVVLRALVHGATGWVPVRFEGVASRPALATLPSVALDDGWRRLRLRLPRGEALATMPALLDGAVLPVLALALDLVDDEARGPGHAWEVRGVRVEVAGDDQAASVVTSVDADLVVRASLHDVPCCSRVWVRDGDGLVERRPQDAHVDLQGPPHAAVYLGFQPPLPAGPAHALGVLVDGATVPPTAPRWEVLGGRTGRWEPLAVRDGAQAWGGTAAVSFSLEEGGVAWIRAVWPGERPPTLGRLSHVLPAAVAAVNVHQVEDERVSGLGVPGQVVRLAHRPVHPASIPEVLVASDDGESVRWRRVLPEELACAPAEAHVFALDPVRGELSFGTGVAGRVLPLGARNVRIPRYAAVPGAVGNLPPGSLVRVDHPSGRLGCAQVLPSRGGRDVESDRAWLARAPSVWAASDRAVTCGDVEALACAAGPEVAEAWCVPVPGPGGEVQVVVRLAEVAGGLGAAPAEAARVIASVSATLEARALVGSRFSVRALRPRPVGIRAVARPHAGIALADLEARAHAALMRALARARGAGRRWGGSVVGLELAACLARVEGVRHVRAVEVLDPASGGASDSLALEDDEVPSLEGWAVRWEAP